MGKEQVARLEERFRQLAPHYQEVILLSRTMGLSHKDIAEIMGKTESSTRNLLYRALAELGEALGDD